jgi:23S rRNA (adenine2503-C2)-methyltransferase
MTELSFTHINNIRSHLRRLGAQPIHEQRILRLWAQAKPQDSGRRPLESFMPTALRNALPEISQSLASLLQLQSAHPAQDGSVSVAVGLE